MLCLGGGGVEMEVSSEKMLKMVYHDFIGYFQMIFVKSENDWILNWRNLVILISEKRIKIVLTKRMPVGSVINQKILK